MRFIGVDPGSIYTGVAVLSFAGRFLFHGEFAYPVDAWYEIWSWSNKDCRITLEDMLGSGRRDAHISRTLKVVGYIQFRCQEESLTVELVPNQARLANVSNVPPEITGKDEISAAAHALSARERYLRSVQH